MEKVKKMSTPNYELLKQIAELTKQIDWDKIEEEISPDGPVSDDEWDEFGVDCHETMYKLREFSEQYI